jgi:PAS domain S-box-containing protein
MNPAMEELTGLSAAESVGKKCYEIAQAKDRCHTGECFLLKILGNGQKIQTEVNVRNIDGTETATILNVSPVYNERGKISGILESFTDITEQKKTERELRESEAFRSKLLDILDNPIFVINPDTSIRYINPAMEKLTGFSAGEIIGTKAPYPWWDKERIQSATGKLREAMNSERRSNEATFRKKNGEEVHVETNSTPVILNGELQYTLVNWVDITERVRNEQALRFSDAALKSIHECVIAMDNDGKIVSWNKISEEVFGIEAEEAIGKGLRDVLSLKEDYPGQNIRRMDILREKGYNHEEQIYVTPRGEVWVDIQVQAISDESGRHGWVTLANDISERKRIDEELRLRAEMLDNAGDAITVSEMDGTLVYANEVFCQSHGYRREDITGKTIFELTSPSFTTSPENFVEMLNEKGEMTFEVIHYTRDGTRAHVEIHSRVIESAGKKLVMNVERDITDRLKREEEIRKLSAAVEYSPSIVMITDRNSIIEYINNKFTEVTGYRSEEVVGKHAGEIGLQPLNEQKAMWKNLLRNEDWTGEFINRKKNGELFYEMASISAIKDHDGNITHFVKMATDITEKKQTEGELERSEKQLRELTRHMRKIREEERKSIARNIHDNLGQMLTALKIDMSWLSKNLNGEQTSLQDRASEMSQLIDQTIQTVKKLSSELRPEMLDILGLAAAIEWHVNDFQKRTGIKCSFACNENDITIEEEHSIDCYRIMQEALTNVYIHSGATKVIIDLKQTDKKMIMRIKDNGKGIPAEKLNSFKSFGLIGMKERAQSIGGTLEIKGNPGQGTTIKLTVPIE